VWQPFNTATNNEITAGLRLVYGASIAGYRIGTWKSTLCGTQTEYTSSANPLSSSTVNLRRRPYIYRFLHEIRQRHLLLRQHEMPQKMDEDYDKIEPASAH